MKKIISVALALMMILSLLSVSAFAQSNVKKSVDRANGKTGQTTTYNWDYNKKSLTIIKSDANSYPYLPLIDYSKISEHPLLILDQSEEFIFAYNEDILSGKINKVILNSSNGTPVEEFRFTVKNYRLTQIDKTQYLYGDTDDEDEEDEDEGPSQLNITETYKYDSKGRITSVNESGYALYTITYDSKGQITSTGKDGQKINWKNGKLSSSEDIYNGTAVYSYDSTGRFIGMESGSNVKHRYSFTYSGSNLVKFTCQTASAGSTYRTTYESTYSY